MTLSTCIIDASHSSLGFAVRHMVIAKVPGKFTKFSGVIKLDEQDMTKSSASVTAEVASIDTSEPKRDEHLRSADFFDVANHPNLTFESKKIEKSGDTYKVTGDLTIHGTKKEVVLDLEYAGKGKDPWGGERVGFSGKTTINRVDFGLKWNQALEAGGVLVGEKVKIVLEIEAIKA